MKKAEIRKLDALWRKIVKSIGRCEKCGRRDGRLDAHHVIGRRNRLLRWEVANGVSLCFKCHIGSRFSAHEDSEKFALWFKKYRPTDYRRIREIADTSQADYITRVKAQDYEEIKAELEGYL